MLRRAFCGPIRRAFHGISSSLAAQETANFLRFAKSTSSFQQKLHAEAVSLLVPEGMSPPELNKGYFYFQRFDADGYVTFCRVPADTGNRVIDIGEKFSSPLEQTVLSLKSAADAFSENGVAEVSAAKIHVDNELLGFVCDSRGDERWTLRFRKLVGGDKKTNNKLAREYLDVSVPLVRNFEWIDNQLVPGRFLLFTEMDPVTLRSVRLVRAELVVNESSASELINRRVLWELSDPDSADHYLDLFKSKDGQIIFVSSSSKSTSEVRALQADDVRGGLTQVLAPEPGVEYYCEHRDGSIFLVSNKEYVNFALYRIDGFFNNLGRPLQKTPRLIHHSPRMTISEMDVFRRGVVLYGTGFEGRPAVEILRFKRYADPDTIDEEGGQPKESAESFSDTSADTSLDTSSAIADTVSVPFLNNYSIGKLELGVNGDFDAEKCVFTFRSPKNAGTCLEFDFFSRKLEATKAREFQHNGYVDMHLYRRFVGEVRIPLTVVSPVEIEWEGTHGVKESPEGVLSSLSRKTDTILGRLASGVFRAKNIPNSPLPCLITVYGAYGQVLEPDFSPMVTALVRRGWVVAFAHVRGGGECGPEWHAAGARGNKLNSVTDFKACIDYLVANNVTSHSLVCAAASSAGGVTLGAALNMYGKSLIGGGAILRVPFVDLVATLEDPALPLSVHEREEWGDVTEEKDRAFLEAIDPIRNVKTNSAEWYPPMLVSGAADDSRVPIEGVVKYVQRLRSRAGLVDPDRLIARFSESGEGGHFGLNKNSYSDNCAEIAFLFKSVNVPLE